MLMSTIGQLKCITCEAEGKTPHMMMIPDLGPLSIVPNLAVVNEVLMFIFEDHKGHNVRGDLNG